MKHLFIPYELALLAKEKGFDEFTFGYYRADGYLENVLYQNITAIQDTHESYCTAPLYQQIIEWFSQKHDIHIEAGHHPWGENGKIVFTAEWNIAAKGEPPLRLHLDAGVREGSMWARTKFNTITEAWAKAIEEAFKLI